MFNQEKKFNLVQKDLNSYKISEEVLLNNNKLLMKNKEIINNLILENINRKDKSFMSIKELEYVKNFETNLINVLEGLPLEVVKKLIEETSEENFLEK